MRPNLIAFSPFMAVALIACGDDTSAPPSDTTGADTPVACVSDCTELGRSICSGDGIRTCELTDDGCLLLGPVASCPTGETCSLGACSDTCQDECETDGADLCDGNAVRTCGQFDADACLDLGEPTACPATGSCSGGVCSNSCADECPEDGARECVGAGSRVCGNHDGDACLEWSAVAACANTDNPCATSACQAGACTLVPVADGAACGDGPCSEGGTCVAGRCDGAVSGCGPGEACVADVCTCQQVITGTAGLATAPLRVDAVDVVFSARINGQPAPTNLPVTEIGILRYRHRHSTDWADLGALGGALDGPSWRLVPGTYDIEYRRGSQHTWREGILTPENPATTFTTVVVPDSGGNVDVDVRAATVSFEARLNGQPAPANLPATELGLLRIRHRGATEWTDIGTIGGQMIGPDWRLLTGTYDYQYRKGPQHTYREGILTPENPATTVGSFEITTESDIIRIPIDAATVTFTARINGQPAPTNLPETERGILSIRHRGATEWIDVGVLGGSMVGPDWRLLKGTYDARYRRGPQHAWREGILTPENKNVVFTSFEITGDGPVDIPLEAATVTFQARINGQPAPTNLPESELGVLAIRHPGETDWLDVGTLGGPMGGPDWRLVTGTYEVQYRRGPQHTWREGVLTPENQRTVFGTIVIPASGGLVPINVPASTVTFNARINGQPAPTNLPESELGRLSLRHEGSTDWFDVGILGGQMIGPDWRLIPGRYEVQYARTTNHVWREGVLTPENESTNVGFITVPATDGPVSIPIEAIDLNFSLRLNGQPAPTTLAESERGLVHILHEGATKRITAEVLGAEPSGYGWRLLTGNYDVVYTRGSSYAWREGILTPENREVVTSCITLKAP